MWNFTDSGGCRRRLQTGKRRPQMADFWQGDDKKGETFLPIAGGVGGGCKLGSAGHKWRTFGNGPIR